MKQETMDALSRLRHDTLANATGIHSIMEILVKYYPPGTKVIITKDYWNIEEPES